MSYTTPYIQFSIDFGVPVWQVRPDYQENLLALEIRDGDRLQTDFAVLDVVSGKLIGTPYRAAENWWVGLEDTQNRQLYLHGFADRKVGSHQGITAVAVDSGQVVWQHEGVYFGLADDHKMIARSISGPDGSFIALDSRTGEMVETDIAPTVAYTGVAAYTRQRSEVAHFPDHYPAGSEYFTWLETFIKTKTGQQPTGAIDYLETGTFLVVAYYVAASDGKVKNMLGVYSVEDGSLLLEVVLAEAGSGVGTGSFFIMQETLIFVQEKNILSGYRFR